MPHSKGFGSEKRKRTADAVPISEVLDDLMRRREFRTGTSIASVMRSWERIVGERLASETVPLSLQNGILVVAASTGAWAAQVRFLEAEIRRNADALLGRNEVKQVRVTLQKPL